MPNDAKMGLAIGVVVVIAIAVVFFRKEPGLPFAGEAAAAVGGASKPAPLTPVQVMNSAVEGKPVSKTMEPRAGMGKHHTVKEGDTLFSLAEQYYGDKDKFTTIYQANRLTLKTPDTLSAGTDLVIPELPQEDR